MGKEGDLAGVQNISNKTVRRGLTRNPKILKAGNVGIN